MAFKLTFWAFIDMFTVPVPPPLCVPEYLPPAVTEFTLPEPDCEDAVPDAADVDPDAAERAPDAATVPDDDVENELTRHFAIVTEEIVMLPADAATPR